jgi:hypothetical protein
MKKTFTIEQLASWIEEIKEAAKDDYSFSIAWFKPTEYEPFSIIAGWQQCYSKPEEVDSSFCSSQSNPTYVMCIKIAENEGPYAYTDYEVMNMPWDRETGDVDDTEIMLEWSDPADYVAAHFMAEWTRLMAAYKNED